MVGMCFFEASIISFSQFSMYMSMSAAVGLVLSGIGVCSRSTLKSLHFALLNWNLSLIGICIGLRLILAIMGM